MMSINTSVLEFRFKLVDLSVWAQVDIVLLDFLLVSISRKNPLTLESSVGLG